MSPVLDSFREVVNNQLNSGHSRFIFTKREGGGLRVILSAVMYRKEKNERK